VIAVATAATTAAAIDSQDLPLFRLLERHTADGAEVDQAMTLCNGTRGAYLGKFGKHLSKRRTELYFFLCGTPPGGYQHGESRRKHSTWAAGVAKAPLACP
jgi:hypothetical protein